MGKKESPEASLARAWQAGVSAHAPGCPAIRASSLNLWYQVAPGPPWDTYHLVPKLHHWGQDPAPDNVRASHTQGNIMVPGDMVPSPGPVLDPGH